MLETLSTRSSRLVAVWLLSILLQQCSGLRFISSWSTPQSAAEGADAASLEDIPDIRYIDESYRKYVGKQDRQHPWHDGVDILSKRGYDMQAVQGPVSDGHINTTMGVMGLTAATPFILQDFYQAYKLDTTWPYCASIHKCLVYVQESNPASRAPVTITPPAGVSAIDMYLDAAIDCVSTMRSFVKCRAVVEPGHVEVKFNFNSICASPFVGKYVGFLDESGDSITSLQLSCKSKAPIALGLVRIGVKEEPEAVLVQQ